MPSTRTEVTEIVTGLGTLGIPSIEDALVSKPDQLANVETAKWAQLVESYLSGEYELEFETAWNNGQAFLESKDGLRGRVPDRVEWKGPHKDPSDNPVPADLRIDHAYLVSCKYKSSILWNRSPSSLFEGLLSSGAESSEDWYGRIAPSEYQALYAGVRNYIGDSSLPDTVADLSAQQREALKVVLSGSWPEELKPLYESFSHAVSKASADTWSSRLAAEQTRERLLWRLLRMSSSPYFMLGTQGASYTRLRIYTPWDWRSEFSMSAFDVFALERGQPTVGWRAEIASADSAASQVVEGHVEIRWSHGRFRGKPEAKVYLDTDHEAVPGYALL